MTMTNHETTGRNNYVPNTKGDTDYLYKKWNTGENKQGQDKTQLKIQSVKMRQQKKGKWKVNFQNDKERQYFQNKTGNTKTDIRTIQGAHAGNWQQNLRPETKMKMKPLRGSCRSRQDPLNRCQSWWQTEEPQSAESLRELMSVDPPTWDMDPPTGDVGQKWAGLLKELESVVVAEHWTESLMGLLPAGPPSGRRGAGTGQVADDAGVRKLTSSRLGSHQLEMWSRDRVGLLTGL